MAKRYRINSFKGEEYTKNLFSIPKTHSLKELQHLKGKKDNICFIFHSRKERRNGFEIINLKNKQLLFAFIVKRALERGLSVWSWNIKTEFEDFYISPQICKLGFFKHDSDCEYGTHSNEVIYPFTYNGKQFILRVLKKWFDNYTIKEDAPPCEDEILEIEDGLDLLASEPRQPQCFSPFPTKYRHFEYKTLKFAISQENHNLPSIPIDKIFNLIKPVPQMTPSKRNIILISGANGVGKDTFTQMLLSNMPFPSLVNHNKFAAIPNQMFFNEFAIDFHSLQRRDKEKVRPAFIQFCESKKEINGQDYWVNLLIDTINNYRTLHNFVISDFRFQIELDTIKKHFENVYIIHIQKSPDDTPPSYQTDHPIYHVKNDKDFEHLENQAIEFIKSVTICQNILF